MKTLKIGALALSIMVATSAVAYPGKAIVDSFLANYVYLAITFTQKIEKHGSVKTAQLVGPSLLLPIQYPKTSAAVAAGLVVASVGAAYVGYKKYTAKATTEVEEIEGTTEQVPA